MTIQLTIGGNTKRSTLGQHPVSIDWDKLPEASQAFIVNYGLKQYLADGMAGAENEAAAKAGVETRVNKLVTGDLSRARGEGKDAPDTVTTRARKIIRALIVAKAKAKGIKTEAEQIKAAVDAVMSDEVKAAPYMEQAKKELDAQAKLADGAGDDFLAALGL
jgi:hypothetical protein